MDNKCKICKKSYYNVKPHITRVHDMTLEDYQKLYGSIRKHYMGITCKAEFDTCLKKLDSESKLTKKVLERLLYMSRKYHGGMPNAKIANGIKK